jgi:hypothetical protein
LVAPALSFDMPKPAVEVSGSQHALVAYCAAIFVSAFLLFQIQLIVGKHFLPWFGGTPAMWTTCMFFFQILLLVGYLYSHILADKLPLRWQGVVHIAVLLSTFSWLVFFAIMWHSPLLPDSRWKPSGPEHPVFHLVVLLGIGAGLPYLTLSTTGPILQSWFARTYPTATPYRLYALSNLGSFLGLLTYPFAVEPWFTLKAQAAWWTAGYCVFLFPCGFCALKLQPKNVREGSPISSASAAQPSAEQPTLSLLVFWLALAACGSLLFLSTTNQICQNIAVVPLLWVWPLSVYLLSLVICFDRPSWYWRAVFHPIFIAGTIIALFLLNGGALTHLPLQIMLYSFILFAGCMVAHGELASSKPGIEHLTLFYLMVATGGAIAGIFVVLVAPRIFNSFSEHSLGLWLTMLLMFLALIRDQRSWLYTRFGLAAIAVGVAFLPGSILLVMGGRIGWNYIFLTGVVLIGVYVLTRNAKSGFDQTKRRAAPWFVTFAMLLLASVFLLSTNLQLQSSILASRNFYGLLTVQEINRGDPEWIALRLSHGRISHGFQFREPQKSVLPTSYYGITSGVGQALVALRGTPTAARDLRVGVIGLGVGTLAAYGRHGDYFRFYEINPDVIRIAGDPKYFTYLTKSQSRLNIVPGDARLSMARELGRNEPQNFDLLVVDAFSGDAPPVHLLTKQAFEIYLREIDSNGVIAVNITNTFIDLQPVLYEIAQNMKLKYAMVHSDGDGRISLYCDWVLLSRQSLDDRLGTAVRDQARPTRNVRLWTDDYSNLFAVLR